MTLCLEEQHVLIAGDLPLSAALGLVVVVAEVALAHQAGDDSGRGPL